MTQGIKFKDASLEEEALSFALAGKADSVAAALVPEDFMASSIQIVPSRYCREIFRRILEIRIPGSEKPLGETVASSFSFDPNLDDANRTKYAALTRKIARKGALLVDDARRLANVVNAVLMFSSKRGLKGLWEKIGTNVMNDDVLAAMQAVQDWTADEVTRQAKISGGGIVSIDWKENAEARIEKMRAACARSKDPDAILKMGIPTGIPPIDERIGGIKGGELMIWLGRTGGGKSIAMQNLAGNFVRSGHQVIYFSQEDSAEEVAWRFDSFLSRVLHPKFRMLQLDNQDFQKWEESVRKVRENQLRICCMSENFTTAHMSNVIRQHQSLGFAPDLIVADYVGLMQPSTGSYRSDLNWESIGQVVKELKTLAVRLGLPVVSAAQLKTEAYEKPLVSMQDAALSPGQINSHANLVCAVVQNLDFQEMQQVRFQLLKNRSTGLGTESHWDIKPDFNRITLSQSWAPMEWAVA